MKQHSNRNTGFNKETRKENGFPGTGTQVLYMVPFTGDPSFFRYRPSHFSTVLPYADIESRQLIIIIRGTDLETHEVRNAFNESIDIIQEYIRWTNDDLCEHNDRLPAQIRLLVDARRTKVLNDQNLVANLGFPLRERADACKTYSADVKRKRPPIERPHATSSAKFKPEPALEMEEYDHILRIIADMATVMERSPSAFATLSEESLRFHILTQLNGHYEGGATGETFNQSGKTDILIRSEEKNVFIAECKFWNGPKSLTKTIDQLLSYTSWRDTKTAILLFNRRKDFSRVLAEIPKTVLQHTCCKRKIEYESETGFRFEFHNRDDVNRQLLMTILAFEIPKT